MSEAATARVAVIGGGPAGLMAADVLARGGVRVDVFDAMPSVGRKFLLAGKGGLNLTHSEPLGAFLTRYGAAQSRVAAWLHAMGPDELRAWANSLGIETFVGTSGRVFPTQMKAAPLLRAWLQHLRHEGVAFHVRHRWTGWGTDGAWSFATRDGERRVVADAVILALGGASWSRLGSDGAWVPLLQARGVTVTPLRSANCGFDVAWSDHLRARYAGAPLKSVAVAFDDADGRRVEGRGEFTITQHGVEGGLIYALSAPLRDSIAARGDVVIYLDLAPDRTRQRIANEIAQPRGSRSWSSHLQRTIGLRGVKAALLREAAPPQTFDDTQRLAAAIKALPLRLVATRPLDEAISSAGGVALDGIDDRLMIRMLPGVFCAGEMLDWEAPTGGYLLTACFASGRVAGAGALSWLEGRSERSTAQRDRSADGI
jgi:uncharacterized flavoprotein (TIGR03862 family)